MLKKNVAIGKHYAIRHSGENRLSVIRLDSVCIYGGWNATKLKTGRTIRIKSAGKLRYEVTRNPVADLPKWVTVERAKELQVN